MTALLEGLRSTTGQMVDLLGEIVSAESPTQDFDATASCSRVVAGAGTGLLGQEPERIEIEGRTHLRWRFGDRPRVLVLGHFDTVWPIGTIDRWPFSVEADNATGPGVFDMKAGIVQGLFAVQALGSPEGVEILFTSDEEVGSPTARPIIEEAARQVAGVLVLEPSFGGALKVARKGVSGYSIDVEGRAAHAGLEPDKGYNALVELAHQVIAVAKIARPEVGTTLTPTVASAGTARNTVPAQARFYVDVRATTTAEQHRVDSEITKLSPAISGTEIKVEGRVASPPLMEAASRQLFALAGEIAKELELGRLEGVQVGGGSDGNYTAAVGAPTLDGLGAVGDGAHAEGEHVFIPAMPERAALVARLIEEIRSGRGGV